MGALPHSKCKVFFQCEVWLDRTEIPCRRGPQSHEVCQSAEQDGNIEYGVDRIVDKRTQYRARWAGYGSEDDEWLTKNELRNTRLTAEAYERRTGLGHRKCKRRRATSDSAESSLNAGDAPESSRPVMEAPKRPRASGPAGELQKCKRGRPRKAPYRGEEFG